MGAPWLLFSKKIANRVLNNQELIAATFLWHSSSFYHTFAFGFLEQKLFLLCMLPKELHSLYNKWKQSQRYQKKEEKTFIPWTNLETCNLLDLKSGFQNEAFSRTKIFVRTSQVILYFDMHDLIWWNMKSWNYDLHFK